MKGRGVVAAIGVVAGVMGVIVGATGQAPQPASAPTALPFSAEAPATPVASPDRIALLLPLSGRQQAVGRAVRDGFVAGLLAAGDSRTSVRFYDDTAGTANAYATARADGAAVIVGPLLKESVEALVPVAGDRPILALNFLGDDRAGPPGFYQFGLAPEDETAAIAARTLAEGRRRAIALAPANDWGRRLLNAFNGQFAAGGGELVAWQFYDPAAGDFSVPVKAVLGAADAIARKQRLQANLGQVLEFEPRPRPDVDFIFVAANASVARLLRPSLRFHGAGDLPAYGTSALYEDGARNETDLDGMWFPDSPWVIAPDPATAALKASLARSAPAGALGVSRLYALGFDAYGLAVRLARGALPAEGYAGATGMLSVDARGRVHRQLGFARIDGGTAMPVAGTVQTGSGSPVP
jgi:outer membrane PBP1 activator LpoA protein